ncbi:TPA: hypothetical protein NIA45_004684 [Pseudomonas aeruginosa]|nr:hypothetical protein [Pseudomonas aeruginosa]
MYVYPHIPAEAFDWADKFSKAAGLKTANSMQILAEFAYFQTSSKFLTELIDNEESRNAMIAEGLGLASAEELISESIDLDDPELMEYVEEADSMLRFDFTEISSEDRAEIEGHFSQILSHHNFTDEFIFFFLRHLSPTQKLIEEIPQFDLEQVFYGKFDPIFFFEFDPRSEDEDEDEPNFIENAVRMAVNPHPAGWIAVMEHLGFKIKEGSIDLEREWSAPAFVFVEDHIDYPVFVLHPSKTPYDDEDMLCNNLRHEIQRSTPSNAFIFWHGPISTGPEDDDRAITFWGEALIEGTWLPLSLRPTSTSISEIQKDAKLLQYEITEDIFNTLGTTDKSLLEIWLKNHVDLMGEMFRGFTERHH